MAKDRALSASGVLAIAFLAQLAGHLLLKQYMPNVAIGGLGFLFVGLIFYYVLIVRHDTFGFILVVYICSHFSYADNQGGLWNLMAFGILALNLAITHRREDFPQRDHLISTLLGIFILWNMLGWVLKNPMPIIEKSQGIAAFFGFILMFRLASNIVITRERLRLFLTVMFFMLLYQFVVGLNQRYYVVHWNDPLTGATLNYASTTSLGTFIHYELFGEYGVLMACLLVPMLSSSLMQREIRFGSNRLVVMIFCCLSFIMLTTNRSSTVLFVLMIAAYYLILPMRIFTSIDRISRQLKLVMVLAILVPLVGVYLGLSNLENKFSAISGQNFTLEGIISGRDINRGETTSAGLNRLQKESWWVGYGSGIPRSNIWAWFGVDPQQQYVSSDYHSLYLSLPELYGWVGSLAFLALILVTLFRSFSISLRFRKRRSFLIVLAVGFTMFWAIFLTNEYKISILRNPNYHMLFWIWLGLTNSVIKTIRYEKQEKNITTPSSASGKKEGTLS